MVVCGEGLSRKGALWMECVVKGFFTRAQAVKRHWKQMRISLSYEPVQRGNTFLPLHQRGAGPTAAATSLTPWRTAAIGTVRDALNKSFGNAGGGLAVIRLSRPLIESPSAAPPPLRGRSTGWR